MICTLDLYESDVRALSYFVERGTNLIQELAYRVIPFLTLVQTLLCGVSPKPRDKTVCSVPTTYIFYLPIYNYQETAVT
jgi:hypothetical protein